MATLDAIVLCPSCRGARLERRDDAYDCPACSRRFPIIDGIPRLLEDVPDDSRQIQRVFDFEHRRYRDSWYTRFEPRLVEQFLDECRLPGEFFSGARALDAGCGSGRWSYALSELGADVVAFDLTSGGIEAAHDNLGDRENVSVCQANVFQPPFAAESFDFVMSWGVLHHTPDTRAAFERLVPLVKPGGTLFVMVYERHSPVMFFFTDIVRWFMRRLPDDRRYRACRWLVVRNPVVARLLGPFLMISYRDPSSEIDEETLQFGLFDAYSPRYNHLHSREEVRGWFGEAGFVDVEVIDTPVGSVRVRGVRAPLRSGVANEAANPA
jgi:2-polyprenyl-3-methyl-5-hydroxy-6-metoxy-1,4-benzoquinol methylase